MNLAILGYWDIFSHVVKRVKYLIGFTDFLVLIEALGLNYRFYLKLCLNLIYLITGSLVLELQMFMISTTRHISLNCNSEFL